LADAENESLRPLWEGIVPGFHHWLESNRSKLFKDCFDLSARESENKREILHQWAGVAAQASKKKSWKKMCPKKCRPSPYNCSSAWKTITQKRRGP